MHDHDIHLSISGALAAVTGVLAVIGLALCAMYGSMLFGFISVHFAAGSCLFRVRSWLCALRAREANAFTLGADSVRSIR
jgi:hypothetical protein